MSIRLSGLASTTAFAVVVLPDPGRAETMTLLSLRASTTAFCSDEGSLLEEIDRTKNDTGGLRKGFLAGYPKPRADRIRLSISI